MDALSSDADVEPDCGRYNRDFDHSRARILRSNTYRDLSTAVLKVTRGMIPGRTVMAWDGLIWPPNQRRTCVMVERAEVGEGYNAGIRHILQACSDWQYILTLEEDNLPPPDAIMKLYESIVDYDIVGGLYWMKNALALPVAFGDPKDGVFHLRPIVPERDTVQRVHMVGLGCTLWRMDVFRRVPEPWFETQAHLGDETRPAAVTTQDVPFAQAAYRVGIKTAVDTRVLVGHLDVTTGAVW